MAERIWECKIGGDIPGDLPGGADQPMRQAIERTFRELAGVDCEFAFTGWGGKLTESERAVTENREPVVPETEPTEWTCGHVAGAECATCAGELRVKLNAVAVTCARLLAGDMAAAARVTNLPMHDDFEIDWKIGDPARYHAWRALKDALADIDALDPSPDSG